jgi:hypothetical protein
MPNKEVFDIKQLPIELFAKSLGINGIPKIRFLKVRGSSINSPFLFLS